LSPTSVYSLAVRLGLQVCNLPFVAVIESAIELSWTRDPFDRIIVGQATLNGSARLTKDRTFAATTATPSGDGSNESKAVAGTRRFRRESS
jgi:PIN domain nuclease of toxin-antitoxin system